MQLLGDRLRTDLLIGLSLRGAGAFSGFAFSWLVSKMFGVSTLGLVQIGLVTTALLANFAGQGLDRLLVREASIAFDQEGPGVAYRLFGTALKRQIIVGGLLATMTFALATWFSNNVISTPEAAPFLQILSPLVLGMAVIRLSSSLLRARGTVLISQALDGVAYTGFAAAAVAVAWLFGWRAPLAPAATYLVGVALVAIFGLALAMKNRSGTTADLANHEEQILSPIPGLKIALMVGMALSVDWIALLLITSYFGPAEAGIYRVVLQFCLLFTLVNSSFAMMAGPHIARAATRQDADTIKATIRRTAMAGVAVSLPVLILLLVFARQALGLFGENFEAGATALCIVAVAQFLNVAFGPVGESLIMMKREGSVLMIEIVALVIAVGTMVILVQTFGMTGVAIGAAVGILTRNGLSALTAFWQIRSIHLHH